MRYWCGLWISMDVFVCTYFPQICTVTLHYNQCHETTQNALNNFWLESTFINLDNYLVLQIIISYIEKYFTDSALVKSLVDIII